MALDRRRRLYGLACSRRAASSDRAGKGVAFFLSFLDVVQTRESPVLSMHSPAPA